jgi:seryl-tRNA synthetase
MRPILALDEAAAEAAQAERNAASKEVGAAKAQGDEAEFERLRALVAEKKDEIARLEDEAKEKDALRDLLSGIPNLPYDDVPDGADEDRQCRDPPLGHARANSTSSRRSISSCRRRPGHGFRDRREALGLPLRAVSGRRGALHRALAQFMLDTHTDRETA